MRILHALKVAASLLAAPAAAQTAAVPPAPAAAPAVTPSMAPAMAPGTAPAARAPLPGIEAIRAGFAHWMQANNVPGLVWAVVENGALVHVEPMGVANRETGEPVTAETRFRLASMTKALTAYTLLTLRDDVPAGTPPRTLDQPVAEALPGLLGWAPDIRIRDLVHHSAGFVTDDPWADRQEAMPAETFNSLLAEPIPLTRAPDTAHEYSNLGYALMGSIIEQWGGRPYPEAVAQAILAPLGMAHSGFDIAAPDAAPLAVGYRFEDGSWRIEPQLGPGAFSPIGGFITNAPDYAKWVAHLLSGWPVEAASGRPGARLREMRRVSGHLHQRARPGRNAQGCPPLVSGYGAGLVVTRDCHLGDVLFHSGGYPGYGSHMLLFPDAGVGLFAFANRTYAAPLAPVWDAADTLMQAGYIRPRPVPRSAMLTVAHAAATRIWARGSVTGESRFLADNMLLDRSAEAWARELARLKAEAGRCDTSAPITPTGALSGTFEWPCERGRIRGQLLLAPLPEPRIQALRLSRP